MKNQTLLSEQLIDIVGEGIKVYDYYMGDIHKGVKAGVRNIKTAGARESIVLYVTNKGFYISYLTKFNKAKILEKTLMPIGFDKVNIYSKPILFGFKELFLLDIKGVKSFDGTYKITKSEHGRFNTDLELMDKVEVLRIELGGGHLSEPEKEGTYDSQQEVYDLDYIAKWATDEDIQKVMRCEVEDPLFKGIYANAYKNARMNQVREESKVKKEIEEGDN